MSTDARTLSFDFADTLAGLSASICEAAETDDAVLEALENFDLLAVDAKRTPVERSELFNVVDCLFSTTSATYLMVFSVNSLTNALSTGCGGRY